MAFRRYRSSGSRFRSSRFRSRPLARKQMQWITNIQSLSTVSGQAPRFEVLAPAQWVVMAQTGAFEQVTLRAVVWNLIMSQQSDPPLNYTSRFAWFIDDVNQPAVTMGTANPANVLFYQNVKPFNTGIINWNPLAGNQVAERNALPYGTQTLFPRARLRSDQSLWLSLQNTTIAGDALQLFSRCLIVRG